MSSLQFGHDCEVVETHFAAASAAAIRALQFGHDCEVVETAAMEIMGVIKAALQFGHDCEVVETRRDSEGDRRTQGASIRPRL